MGYIVDKTNQVIMNGESAIAVTAVPTPGNRFVKWSDGVMTATRQDVCVTESLTITAIFEKVG